MNEFVTGYECMTCEATGYVYVGFNENDVEECTKCENGYIEVKKEGAI